MSAVNSLYAKITCRNCGGESRREVQFKFGDTYANKYELSDTLRWGGNDIGHSGVRRVVVDGAARACPICGDGDLDFEIWIENDRITRVEPLSGRFDFTAVNRTYIVVDP